MNDLLLTEEWLQQLAHYQRLMVGFSGGLDSTVLLHRLAQEVSLKPKLQAVHIHHGISAHADAWQKHCQKVSDHLSISLTVRKIKVEGGTNIEEQARLARYQVFSEMLTSNDCLLLAHHCNDQAETMLLQLLRGAGIDGLAAMSSLKEWKAGHLVRPFLPHSRQMLETYARFHQLTWVDDESNDNTHFSRNYLRHRVIPLLEEKWPQAVSNLVRSATHCQQAKENLETLAELDYQGFKETKETLNLARLRSLSPARLTNVLRTWFKHHQLRAPSFAVMNRIVDEVIEAKEDALPSVTWDNVTLTRYQQQLYLIKNEPFVPSSQCLEWQDISRPLFLGSQGEVKQYLKASSALKGLRCSLGQKIQVRFRQGGEVFYWHQQTKSLKKLFQQWQVPPWCRSQIPLIYINNELAAIVGYGISDHFLSVTSESAYQVSVTTEIMHEHIAN